MINHSSKLGSLDDNGSRLLLLQLKDWADVMLLAPLSANTMAKIANGLADNLLVVFTMDWTVDHQNIY